MSQLAEALAALYAHEGVEHLILLGYDGLVIRHLGDAGRLDADTLAAMLPAMAVAARAAGRAAQAGEPATLVAEYEGGVLVLGCLSGDLLLALLLRREVGFAPLLRQLRRERGRLAGLL